MHTLAVVVLVTLLIMKVLATEYEYVEYEYDSGSNRNSNDASKNNGEGADKYTIEYDIYAGRKGERRRESLGQRQTYGGTYGLVGSRSEGGGLEDGGERRGIKDESESEIRVNGGEGNGAGWRDEGAGAVVKAGAGATHVLESVISGGWNLANAFGGGLGGITG